MNRLAGRYAPTTCPVSGCVRLHGVTWVPASTPRPAADDLAGSGELRSRDGRPPLGASNPLQPMAPTAGG